MTITTKITIRPATLADVPRLNKLVNGAYRGESGLRGWTTEAHILGGVRTDEQRIAEIIEEDDSVILVAIDSSGDLQACVHLQSKNESTAYLGMLTVKVDTQARGWGSRLLEESENFVAREWKKSEVEMTVITVRDELIAWYERRGYAKTGERRPFPHDERFGIPLKGPLEFFVLAKSLQ